VELRSGDVVVRRWRPADARAHVAALDHDDVARWIDFPRPLREADALAFFARGTPHFGIFGADGLTVIGGVGLDPVHLDRPAWAEIDWWVTPSARRRGVARTAIGLVVEWAFASLGLARVEARIQRENEASLALAAACGFAPLGSTVRREHRGREVELLRYELRPSSRASRSSSS
jgi:[ribosomal protein S5]-alanine N-acetyltransferase